MAKNDLIGGSLWEHYSNKVSQRMDNPLHRGEITEEEAKALGAKLVVADYGAESCGDAVRLYWAVDEKTGRILDAKFKSFGCGTAIASSDMMAELCIGKTVDEAVKITNLDVERALRDDPETPAVPPQKMHCSVMAYDVIKKAAAIYKGVDMSAFEEEIIVCECARVSLSTIREVIRLNDLKSVEEITQYTKAGAFCKSCIKPGGHESRDYYLVDILRDVRAEMEREKQAVAATTEDFRSMTLVRQLKLIEQVLDENIRPMLAMDGGNLEVLDLRHDGEYIDLYIRYLGGCAGCASSSTGTLYAIEGVLRQKIDPKIRVLPL
ncbi:MAG: iron-sulfur cluster assembly scaffold protein [Campylobacterales bacterium]